MPDLKPALLSVRWAASWRCPVASGTERDVVAGGGGGGGVMPVVVVVVEEGPRETLMRTRNPRTTRLPPTGRCATTIPSGSGEGTVTALGTSPAPRSVETAAARLWPVTSGTSTSRRETRI